MNDLIFSYDRLAEYDLAILLIFFEIMLRI